MGDVTVIDRKELKHSGNDSLAGILGRHSGFSLYDSGGPQTQTSVFLRGANPAQTLVLVDGMRINSITSGAINWGTIDPSSIERVEIVRGAASSLYGSNAIGGVVNIITRKGDAKTPNRTWLTMGAGSYGTTKSSAGTSGHAGALDYSFTTSLANSDGFSATTPDSSSYYPDNDGYAQHAFSGALGYRWAKGQRLDFTAYNSYLDGQFDAGSSSPEAYSKTRQQVYTLASTNQLTDAWQSVLRFGFSREAATGRSYGSDDQYGSINRNYVWQNNLTLDDAQNISLLLERLEERTLPGSTRYTATQRNTNAAGLVYRADFDRHHLQASVRNDAISGYGSKTTGGLSYAFDLSPEWRAGLAANTGFRAPGFSDLYWPDSFGYVGNPNLKPERSRNVEANLKYQTETTDIGVAVFQNKVQDLIASALLEGSTDTYTAMNINQATLRGLSLTAEHRLENTTLRAGADFLDARNDTPSASAADDQLPFRARQVYRFSALQRLGALELGAEFQFTGKRYNDTNNTEQLGGYGLTNLTAEYALNKHASVQVRWNNILNKDYVTMKGYRTPGSNVFVTLSVQM